jgi:tetratricopeptide (TPR) repeat protein
MGLVRALIPLGHYDQAWNILDQIPAPEADEDIKRQRAEILFAKGRILGNKTKYEEAEAVLHEAATLLLARGSDDLVFQIQHALFWIKWVKGLYREAGKIAKEMYLDAMEGQNPARLCLSKLAFAYFNVVAGDLSLSVKLAEQAVLHSKEIGHPYRELDAFLLLSSAQELVGLYYNALSTLDVAKLKADRLKASWHQASINISIGRTYFLLGNLNQALSSYRSAVAIAEQLADDRILANALIGQTRSILRRRDKSEILISRENAQRALSLVKERIPSLEAEAHLALAEISLFSGENDLAAQHAKAAVEIIDTLGTPGQCGMEIYLVAHESLLALGNDKAADDILQRAWRTLTTRSLWFSDEAIRESYTQNVPHNRAILDHWKTRHG